MRMNNVILIAADQLRYDILGKGFTPTIDTLIGESTVFTSAYCTSPLCVPARGSLFTGTFPNTSGSLINPWHEPDVPFGLVTQGIKNMYQVLSDAGYDCFHSGKQHLYLEGGQPEDEKDTPVSWLSTEKTYKQFLAESGLRRPGGKEYRTICPKIISGQVTKGKGYSNPRVGVYEAGVANYFDGYFTDRLLEGLKGRDKERPLFVSAMFLAPHPPFCIPEPYFSLYDDSDVMLPENVGLWAEGQSPLQLYQVTGAIGTGYTQKEWRESWRVYLGLCTLLDDQVKRILDYLKAEGLYEDSLIIFTSDHGEMLGSHQLFQKMCMYEEASKVPLSFKFPHEAGFVEKTDLVSHVDVFPTICDFLGIETPDTVEGDSLLQGDVQSNKAVFLQFDGTDYLGNYSRCVVKDGYKLILDIFKDEIFIELYNLKNDPQEMLNLAFDAGYQVMAEELIAELGSHMKRTNDHYDLPPLDVQGFVAMYKNI